MSNPECFRKAREQARLSVSEAAPLMGVSEATIWDLETYPDELVSIYSPAQLQRFSKVLGVRPAQLVGASHSDDPISATALASLIRDYCVSRNVTIEQFEETAGWEVAESLNQPKQFLSAFSIDGIKDICGVLGVDWQRFINGLE